MENNKIIPFAALGLIHILFILNVAVPKVGHLAWIGLLALIAYPKIPMGNQSINGKALLTDTLGFAGGMLFTIWLIIKFGWSPVFTAALIGTLVAFIPSHTAGTKPYQIINLNHAKLAAYAGAFAGMSNLNFIGSLMGLLLVGAIGGVLYHVLRSSFEGLGGKLGSIGFGAVIIFITLQAL